jgi:hypothetical protein
MLLQPLNPHADSKGNDDGKMADADGHLRTVAIQDFFPMELPRLQRHTAYFAVPNRICSSLVGGCRNRKSTRSLAVPTTSTRLALFLSIFLGGIP